MWPLSLSWDGSQAGATWGGLDTPASFACTTSLLSWLGGGGDYSPGAPGSGGLCKARLQLKGLGVLDPLACACWASVTGVCLHVRSHASSP